MLYPLFMNLQQITGSGYPIFLKEMLDDGMNPIHIGPFRLDLLIDA